jgi:O-antigen/teichoic acid export membrane protein
MTRTAYSVHGAAFWVLASRIGFAATGLAINAQLARLMPPGDFGAYLLAVSIVSTLTLVGQLGLPGTVVRLAAQHLNSAGAQRAAVIVERCTWLAAAGAVTLAAAYLLAGGRLIAGLFDAPQLRDHTVYIAVWLCAAAPLGVMAEGFRGLLRNRLAGCFGGLSHNALLLTLILAVAVTFGHMQFGDAVAAAALCASVSLLFAWAALRLTGRDAHRQGTAHRAPTAPALLRESLPLLVTGAAIFVTTQVDLWIAGAAMPAAETAAYGAAARLVQLTLLPALVVNAALAPAIARLLGGPRSNELQQTLRTWGAVAALPAVATLALLLVIAPGVLQVVYGPGYAAAAPCLLMLCAGQAINACAGPAATLLTMAGNGRALMGISVACACLVAVAGILLAHPFGIVGIAAAAAAGSALHGWACAAWARHRLRIVTLPSLSGLLREVTGQWRAFAHARAGTR